MKRNAGLSLGLAGLLDAILTTRCSTQNDPGTAGSRRRTGSGGATGQGGSSPGTGGGAVTGTGGATTGTGGNGSGGSTTGTGGKVTGTGGVTGAGGAGTGGAALSINDIIPGFDGFYWEASPSGNTALSGTNYPFGPAAGGCPTGASWATTGYINTQTKAVKGVTGQQYRDQLQRPRRRRHALLYRRHARRNAAAGGHAQPERPQQHLVHRRHPVQRQHLEHHGDPRRAGGAERGQRLLRELLPEHLELVPERGDVRDALQRQLPGDWRWYLTFTIHDSNCRTLANCGQVENQATCDTAAATSSTCRASISGSHQLHATAHGFAGQHDVLRAMGLVRRHLGDQAVIIISLP